MNNICNNIIIYCILCKHNYVYKYMYISITYFMIYIKYISNTYELYK